MSEFDPCELRLTTRVKGFLNATCIEKSDKAGHILEKY